MDAPKMYQPDGFRFPEYLEEHRDRGSVLYVTHKCGHPGRLSYGSRQAADGDRANQEGQVCSSCLSSALLAGTPTPAADPDIENYGPGDVYLNVTHICGHRSRLLFGTYEAAVRDKKKFQDQECVPCWRASEAKK